MRSRWIFAASSLFLACSSDPTSEAASKANLAQDADASSPPGAVGEDDGGPGPLSSAPESYTNPVFAGDFPDPFVLDDGTRYLAFGTNAGTSNVRTLTSGDLASWSELPDALPTLPAWAKANASLTWAPSVLKRGGNYVLYYTARSIATGFQCIGRATAKTAAGPYTDDSNAPFICQVDLCGSIDASPFVDENGDAYLLWKSDENADACSADARIWTQRLGVDGTSLLGNPTELARRDQTWERPLIEGPSMMKYQASYYLFYSANWWESSSYGIGYAVCTSPAGPCTKKTIDGPLTGSTGDVLGPGGQEMFTDHAGKRWVAYHAWSAPIVGYANGGARSLRVDPLVFDGVVPRIDVSTAKGSL